MSADSWVHQAKAAIEPIGRAVRLGARTVGGIAIVGGVVLVLVGSAGGGMSVGVELPTWDTNGDVFSVARDGQSIFLGGDFTYVGPHTGGGAFVRASDGSLDQAFPAFDGGKVLATVDDGSGGYFVGGSFTLAAGARMPYLVHVLADGSLDRSWQAGADAPVEAMVRIGSTLYVGGNFTLLGGAARHGLGALDVGSAHATVWKPGNTGGVTAMATIGSAVYIGLFDLYTDSGQVTRVGLAAVDDDTGALLPFAPNVGTPSTLAVSGTTLYLGGVAIPSAGQDIEVAAYDTQTGVKKPWAPVFNGAVDQLVVQNGTVYVIGGFTSPTPGMAAIDATTGAPRQGWQPPENPSAMAVAGPTIYVGTWTAVNQRQHSRLVALSASTGALQPWSISLGRTATYVAVVNDHVIVGGDFIEAGGLDRAGLTELDAQTGAGLPFDVQLAGGSQVNALSTHAGTLYFGGDFASVQGQPRSGVAAVDIGSDALLPWAPQVSYVGPDQTFLPIVKQISVADASVYFAGQFNRVDGAVRDGLAAVAVDGTLSPFDAQLAGQGTVDALLATPTAVYVGGSFLNAGGAERHHLAALDPATGAANDWNPSPNGEVDSLAIDGDTVYAAGQFGSVGGASRPSIAGISAATGAVTSFAPSLNADVFAIAAADGTLFVASGGGTVSGANTDGYFAIDLATGTATSFPSYGSQSPETVAATADGKWAGFGLGGADGVGYLAGPVRSGYTSFAVSAAPPSAPGGNDSGGSRSGGGGGPLDLATSASVSPTQVAPGGFATFHIVVTDLTKTPATHLHVTVALPLGAVVASTSADRGQGCKATGVADVLSCDLDYLAGSPTVGNITITVTLPQAGLATLVATAAADQSELNTTNNSASATVQVEPPEEPPAVEPPPLPSPVLKHVNTRALTAVVRGTTERVSGRVRTNEAVRLTMSVIRLHATRRLVLRKNSSLASRIAATSSLALSASVAHPGTFSYRAILSRKSLSRGSNYLVRLTAMNADGKTRMLTIPFRA